MTSDFDEREVNLDMQMSFLNAALRISPFVYLYMQKTYTATHRLFVFSSTITDRIISRFWYANYRFVKRGGVYY